MKTAVNILLWEQNIFSFSFKFQVKYFSNLAIISKHLLDVAIPQFYFVNY